MSFAIKTAIIKKLKGQDVHDIGIAIHDRPDGDCVGSAVALESGLKALGKNAEIIVHDKIPRNFTIVGDRVDKVIPIQRNKKYDIVFVLDCSSESRTVRELRKIAKYIIVIDHHPIIEKFGDIYWQEPVACAGIMVYQLLKRITTITPEIATAVYFALRSDTGNFRFSNTNKECFLLAAELLDLGADVAKINDMMDVRTLSSLKLLGNVANRIQHDPVYKITHLSVPREIIKKSDASDEEASGLVDAIRNIEGTEIAILFIEGISNIRVRFRSKHIPINEVAQEFGGGGHDLASGAAVEGYLEDVVSKVLHSMIKYLEGGSYVT